LATAGERTYVGTLPARAIGKINFARLLTLILTRGPGPEIPMLNPEYRNQPRDVKSEISD